MAIRKDKGQDCIEVYIPSTELNIGDIDVSPLKPNEDEEYRVCDVEEDGEINWYLPEEHISTILSEDDRKEIEELAEGFIY